MTEEMRKRLEEAAEKYALEHKAEWLHQNFYVSECEEGFLAGAEWMFKEAGGEMVFREMRRMILAQCKEWLKENFFTKVDDNAFLYWDSNFNDITEALADFEADMTKLWEGEK